MAMAEGTDAPSVDFFEAVELESSDARRSGHLLEGDSWFLKGFVKANGAYSVHDRSKPGDENRDAGWSQRRLVVDALVDGQLGERGSYRINGNISLDPEGEMDNGFEWREVYLNWELTDDLWFKSGRQIIAWGESDFTQILDQANPRDQREIGVVDAVDVRIPVWSTRLSRVGNRWGADLVATHEFRGNREAGRGDDFDPYINLRDGFRIGAEEEPDLGLDEMEWLARLFFSFRRGDLSLIYANVYDDEAALRLTSPGQLEPFHGRMQVVGAYGNWVQDDWLFKFELGYKDNVEFMAASGPQQPVGKPLTQLMLGADYAVNPDLTLSVEWLGEHIGDYDEPLLFDRDRYSTISGMRVDLWRDTAEFSVFWGHYIQTGSDTLRVQFDYDLDDHLTLGLGAIGYWAEGRDSYLYPYRDDDRLFVSVQYNF